MNKLKRQHITVLVSLLELIKNEVEYIYTDELNYFNKMPISIQKELKGEEAEFNIGHLEFTMEDIGKSIDNLKDILSR